jgi:hypothetical protein
MCDYDYEFAWGREAHVIARIPHECCSCGDIIPRGHRCFMGSGRNNDGVLQNDFICQTCEWMMDETLEGTPAHICRGDILNDGGYDNANERHEYVRQCLEEGEPVIMAVLQLINDGFLQGVA